MILNSVLKRFSQYTLLKVAPQKYSIMPFNSQSDKPKKTLGGVKTKQEKGETTSSGWHIFRQIYTNTHIYREKNTHTDTDVT